MFKEKCEKLNKVNSVPKEKKSYSVSEIAYILGICKETAYTLIKKREFQSVKVKKQIRIDKRSFDKWLDEQNKGGCKDGINS